MANLFTSMRASVTSLDALQRSATASQNNVTNASTPGYAKQRIRLEALGFDPEMGLAGGVLTAGLTTARDEYVENAVREQTAALGNAQENSTQLSLVEAAFDLNDVGGITTTMDKLYSTFSAWSVAPQGTTEKENVLSAAVAVAESFNRTANSLQRASQNSETRIQTTLSKINDLAERVRQHNIDIRKGGGRDGGLDASMHADLEELSSLTDAQIVFQKDGTATVLIGRETPLVMGDRRFEFSLTPDPTPPPAGFAGATPAVMILDQSGQDVTSTMTGGTLGALLTFRNTTIPSHMGSVSAPGDLNRLAKAFADRVNQLLTAGDSSAVPLFQYQSTLTAAASLEVNPAISASTLSATDVTTTPPTGNGRALSLANLAHPNAAADMLDGSSYISFFARMSADAGRLSGEASRAVDSHRQMLSQAQTLRGKISGVSLNDEAVNLVAVQRAYEATSRMIATLDEMTKIAVNIGRA